MMKQIFFILISSYAVYALTSLVMLPGMAQGCTGLYILICVTAIISDHHQASNDMHHVNAYNQRVQHHNDDFEYPIMQDADNQNADVQTTYQRSVHSRNGNALLSIHHAVDSQGNHATVTEVHGKALHGGKLHSNYQRNVEISPSKNNLREFDGYFADQQKGQPGNRIISPQKKAEQTARHYQKLNQQKRPYYDNNPYYNQANPEYAKKLHQQAIAKAYLGGNVNHYPVYKGNQTPRNYK